MWSTLITYQQARIYRKRSLGFANYLVCLLYDIRGNINISVTHLEALHEHINVPIACKELNIKLVDNDTQETSYKLC